MKNRVIRSSIAVILVLAMMFSMAACGSDADVATTTPTTTPTTTATTTPTTAPEVETATVAPTVTPTTTPDTVAEQFGISLTAVGGTYGTDLDINEDETDDGDYGYFKLTIDQDLTASEQYSVVVYLDNTVLYSTNDLETYADDTIAFSSYYDGDAADADVEAVVTGRDTKAVYLAVKQAGSYEIELDVEVYDTYTDFGAWQDEDKAEYETTLSASLEVAKKQVTISPSPVVVLSDEDYALELLATSNVYAAILSNDSSGTTDDITFSSFKVLTDYIKATNDSAISNYALKYSISYTEECAEGTYAVSVVLYDTVNSEEIDIEDLNDELINNEIVAVNGTSIYALSAYDWNEILDVVTSIAEIEYDSTDGFLKDGNNYATQLPLALARYNALSTAQQAFFSNGTISQLTGITFTEAYVSGRVNGVDVNTWATANSKTLDSAATFKAYMDAAEEAVNLAIIIEAFEDAVSDSKLGNYIIATDDTELGLNDVSYYVETSAAITAYNYVESYWNSLSEDDQDDIIAELAHVASEKSDSYWDGEVCDNNSYSSTTAVNASAYDKYMIAKTAYDDAAVATAQEYTVAAFAAYVKAINNGSTVIYTETCTGNITKWGYINSTEVRTLTAKAVAAYEALSDDQQDVFEASTDSAQLVVSQSTIAKDYVVVDTDVTFDEILDKLVAMNEMVDVMIEISDYVNIEDYQTESVYTNLYALVYGPSALSFYGSNYAMQDIIDAPSRNYDAIIDEYVAWIDFLLYMEDYKDDLLDEFKDLVTDYFDENADDYSDETISAALAFSNSDYDIAKASIYFDFISDNAGTYGWLTTLDIEDFETAYEEFVDALDIEDVVDTYVATFPEA